VKPPLDQSQQKVTTNIELANASKILIETPTLPMQADKSMLDIFSPSVIIAGSKPTRS